MRLLALGHEADYPLAKASPVRFFTDLDATLRRRAARSRPGARPCSTATTTDLVVTCPRATGDDFQRFVELLELADEFCRAGAAAVAGPHARADAFQTLVPRRVRAAGQRRAADALAAARSRRATAPERLVTRPAPALLRRGGRSAARSVPRCAGGWATWCPTAPGFPWTTFAINVTGSLALALLPAFGGRAPPPDRSPPPSGPACWAATPRCRRTPSRHARCSPTAAARSPAAYLLGTLAACLVAVTLAGHLSSTPGAARSSRPRRATSDAAAGRARRGASGPPLRFWVGHHLDDRFPLGHARWSTWPGRSCSGCSSGRARPAHALALLGTGFCGGLHDLLRVRRADPHRLGRGPRPRRTPSRPSALALAACALGFAIGQA